MDIDEFLDRELADLISDSNKIENPKQENLLNLKGSELSFDSIKSSLGKGNLEKAEVSYHKLWAQLMGQKLKWKPELYDQLMILSRQFSSVLSDSYNEAKNKSARISELIARARAALREGRRDAPYKLYGEMQELSNSIPNIFFEIKKAVQDQILDFYKELTNTTDSELIKKVSALMLQINQIIGKISASIISNDIENASANYNKCIELYNQVPEGFLTEKNPAGMKLLDIYKNLSIYMEISNLQRQLAMQKPSTAMPLGSKIDSPAIASQPASYQKYAYQRQPEKMAYSRIDKPKSNSEQMAEQKKAVSETTASKSELLSKKVQRAKRDIKKGLYNEAWKDLEEALYIDPNDVESKALRAKVKTLQ